MWANLTRDYTNKDVVTQQRSVLMSMILRLNMVPLIVPLGVVVNGGVVAVVS